VEQGSSQLEKLLKKEQDSKIRPRLQMNVKSLEEEAVPFEVEPHTNIRIHDVRVPMSRFKERMIGRKYISIENIVKMMIGDEIEDDWVTIGVIYHRSKRFENKLGQKIQCYDCTDLKDNYFRMFAIDLELDECKNGSVIAVLNCDIIKPSEVNQGHVARWCLGVTITESKIVDEIGRIL
jgi:hypothetical protein